MIRSEGNAESLYYECRGPNARLAQMTADRTLNSLAKRGLVFDGENGWEITDAGREVVAEDARAEMRAARLEYEREGQG